MIDPSFVVDRRILGTAQHLMVTPDGVSWVELVPFDTWHLSGELKGSDRCLDTLLKLEGLEVEVGVPEQFKRAMLTLMSGSQSWPPPWQSVMPKAAHRRFVGALLEQIKVAMEKATGEYYNRVWVPGNHAYSQLQRACINGEVFAKLLAAGEGNLGALRSFQPDEQGFAHPVVYNRFGSRTGRPTIASGPNILTLKREHRALLGSRWGKDGVVVLLDFKAMEVRVVLYDAGHRCENPDLYDEINQVAFAGKLNRNLVKEAVICELYGQSKWSLGEKLGIKGKHLDAFINRIRTHFKLEQLLHQVKMQFVQQGFITNRYGRRVRIDEPLDHVLVNSYAQSTGADVVTLGFNQIMKRLQGVRAIPIFFLVDALLLDVHIDDIGAVKAIDSVTVDGYVQKWPLKFEVVAHEGDLS